MVQHLTNSAMLDALKRVQAAQIAILNAGYSAHVDANFHTDWLDSSSTYITFNLVVFDHGCIIKAFDFTARETQETIDATCSLVEAFAKSL